MQRCSTQTAPQILQAPFGSQLNVIGRFKQWSLDIASSYALALARHCAKFSRRTDAVPAPQAVPVTATAIAPPSCGLSQGCEPVLRRVSPTVALKRQAAKHCLRTCRHTSLASCPFKTPQMPVHMRPTVHGLYPPPPSTNRRGTPSAISARAVRPNAHYCSGPDAPTGHPPPRLPHTEKQSHQA